MIKHDTNKHALPLLLLAIGGAVFWGGVARADDDDDDDARRRPRLHHSYDEDDYDDDDDRVANYIRDGLRLLNQGGSYYRGGRYADRDYYDDDRRRAYGRHGDYYGAEGRYDHRRYRSPQRSYHYYRGGGEWDDRGRQDDAEFISSLYAELLRREAVPSEMDYWLRRLDWGMPRYEVVRRFRDSREHQALRSRDYHYGPSPEPLRPQYRTFGDDAYEYGYDD